MAREFDQRLYINDRGMKRLSRVRIMSHAQSDCVCPENSDFIYQLACNVYNLDRCVKANP